MQEVLYENTHKLPWLHRKMKLQNFEIKLIEAAIKVCVYNLKAGHISQESTGK